MAELSEGATLKAPILSTPAEVSLPTRPSTPAAVGTSEALDPLLIKLSSRMEALEEEVAVLKERWAQDHQVVEKLLKELSSQNEEGLRSIEDSRLAYEATEKAVHRAIAQFDERIASLEASTEDVRKQIRGVNEVFVGECAALRSEVAHSMITFKQLGAGGFYEESLTPVRRGEQDPKHYLPKDIRGSQRVPSFIDGWLFTYGEGE